jgi:hypothetical protein
MSNLKRLIRREVDRQKEVKIGTVLNEMHLQDFDGGGSGVWVSHVSIGSDEYLRDVPVKAQHSRFYAQIGQTVALRKSAQGRWEIVGPGDRAMGIMVSKTYTLATGALQTTENIGFYSNPVPFDYYATADLSAPLDVLWADTVTPFGLIQIISAKTGLPV